jgi:hypothetical protein
LNFITEFDLEPLEIDTGPYSRDERLKGILWRLVFTVDETGCSEHVESREVKVMATVNCPDSSVPVPVDRVMPFDRHME